MESAITGQLFKSAGRYSQAFGNLDQATSVLLRKAGEAVKESALK
jgi:hypothetical protein